MRPATKAPQIQPHLHALPAQGSDFAATWADPLHPTVPALCLQRTVPLGWLERSQAVTDAFQREFGRRDAQARAAPHLLPGHAHLYNQAAAQACSSSCIKVCWVAEATACTNPWSLILNERLFNCIQMTNVHRDLSSPTPGNILFENQNKGLEGWLSRGEVLAEQARGPECGCPAPQSKSATAVHVCNPVLRMAGTREAFRAHHQHC